MPARNRDCATKSLIRPRTVASVMASHYAQSARITISVAAGGRFTSVMLLPAATLMTFSRQILAGLAGGIITGLFFGEQASALKWAADGFVSLLQMMVLPYITVSIVASLGSLDYAQIRTLGLRAAAVVGGLWLVALSFAFLIPLTFPSMQNASFFSSSLVERRPTFDFVGLYIPANPFNALANNVVPAVVLFSVILGIGLVGVERKKPLLDVLQVAKDAISAATRLVNRLTPYGLFAIAANAAGTMGLEQLSRLQVYLAAYVAVALLVSLWVLPGLVGRAHADSSQRHPQRVARRAHGRLHRRRPVHRAAGAHPGEPHAARPAGSRRPRAGAADRRHRAGVLQLPAYREAALPELRALRGMVRRRAGAGVAISAAGAHRAPQLLRQPHRGGAVPARSVPDSGRHVPAVSRDRRHQLARGIAGRRRSTRSRWRSSPRAPPPATFAGGAGRS